MHYSGWVIAILLPPVIAFVVWRLLRFTESGDYPQQGVRLGKRGYWIILIILYVTVFASALIEHKI